MNKTALYGPEGLSDLRELIYPIILLQIDFHAAFDTAVSSYHMVIDDFTDLLTSDSPSQQRSY